jgi:cytoskeletal protein RodZ
VKQTKQCHCCDGSGVELDHVQVGAQLRTLRQSKQLTLLSVSRRLKLSLPYLSDLERGRRNWNDALAERFRKACT